MRQHSPDVLGPAAQRGHENRALTEVGCCAPGVPGLAAAGRASDKHEPVAHRRPLSRRAVREGSRERLGPQSECQRIQCRASHAGCSKPMGRGCNMQACRHHPASRLARVGPASVRVQQQPDRSSQSAAGRYLPRYQRSAAACPEPRTTTVTSCDGAPVQITNERSVRSG